jgi:predicted AlkP superfamily pyrophosphatase or phosphodiesterase
MGHKKNRFLICTFLPFWLGVVSCGSESGTDQETPSGKVRKHVLVIGIDGLRPDALVAANTPALDELIGNGAVTYDAYAGGERRTQTQQATSSGPGWSSILTGVWVDKHNVSNNEFSDPHFDRFPCFFTRIREVRPKAFLSSIVHWSPINERIVEDADLEIEVDSDSEVAVEAVDHLQGEDPDVLFLQFDDVDHAGHSYFFSPFSPRYLEAVQEVDTQIGSVIETLQARPGIDDEDWLVVVTTDHGGFLTGHGSQLPMVRTIFMIVSGKGASPGEHSPGPGMVAVPATVLRHLGFPVDPAWGWEADAFGLALPAVSLGWTSRGSLLTMCASTDLKIDPVF